MSRFSAVRAAAFALALVFTTHQAAAMSVRPMVLDLQTSGRGMSQVVSVENNSEHPLPVELNVQELRFDHSGNPQTGRDPGDLVVFPAQALIQPGQAQTFRIQYVGDAGLDKSRHYYITVAQLPVRLSPGQSGIQVLYNFNVLASVGPQHSKSALRVLSAEVGRNEAGKPVPLVTLGNDSVTYGYLSSGELRILEKDGTGREVFRRTLTGPEIQQMLGMGLMASAQTRQFALPLVLPAEDGTVTVQFVPGK
jgi:fimbrial chaperone protein